MRKAHGLQSIGSGSARTLTQSDLAPARLRRIAARASAWFEVHQRDLPWRRERSGYTAMVSEAMLQQTQAQRVIEPFEAFIARFPDIEKLAAAEEQDVLAMWNGLGYYRRARLLHRAAQKIVEDHGGAIPSEARALKKLPGVGEYTAGAIASIVFDHPEAIVDGNIARILSRLFAVDAPAESSREWMWDVAQRLVEGADSPARLNEGLMELGATVCTPAAPACGRCPLRRMCRANHEGTQRAIPRPRRAAAKRTVHHHAILARRDDGSILLERRPPHGLWAGMWQPPAVESDVMLSAAAVRKRVALPAGALRRCGGFTHQTTHRTVVFHLHRCNAPLGIAGREWIAPREVESLPMSNAHKRILREFDAHQARNRNRRPRP